MKAKRYVTNVDGREQCDCELPPRSIVANMGFDGLLGAGYRVADFWVFPRRLSVHIACKQSQLPPWLRDIFKDPLPANFWRMRAGDVLALHPPHFGDAVVGSFLRLECDALVYWTKTDGTLPAMLDAFAFNDGDLGEENASRLRGIAEGTRSLPMPRIASVDDWHLEW